MPANRVVHCLFTDTTDASVSLSGDALFALAKEDIGDRVFYFDKWRILALFGEWEDIGWAITTAEPSTAWLTSLVRLDATMLTVNDALHLSYWAGSSTIFW